MARAELSWTELRAWFYWKYRSSGVVDSAPAACNKQAGPHGGRGRRVMIISDSKG